MSQYCPSLPAPSCPTTPAYNECHQISTYDSMAVYPRRYLVRPVDDSVPTSATPCDNIRLQSVAYRDVDVCSSLTVGCAFESKGTSDLVGPVTASSITAPTGQSLNLSQGPVTLGSVNGNVAFSGSVTFAQSPYYLSSVGGGVGLVNPTTESGPDFELFSLVSNTNSIGWSVNPGGTVSADLALAYPSFFQGSFSSPAYSSGAVMTFAPVQPASQPAFASASVVVPAAGTYLVSFQTWLVAPFGGATYFQVNVNSQPVATRVLPTGFPAAQTFYDAFTVPLTLAAATVPVSVTFNGIAQTVFEQVTFARIN